MWEFLRSLIEVIREAIRSWDATIRLGLLLCLLIVILWITAK